MAKVSRRMVLSTALGAAPLIVSARLAYALFPDKTITVIVPYPAGGTTDLLGRLVVEQLRVGLGTTVVVQNIVGAGTSLGAAHVARSQADGYTLLMATSTTLAINKALYKKLPYDPIADFAPIALVAGVPFALIINPTLPVTSLAEFISYVKARPGELAYGSAGIGSPQHLGGEILCSKAGLKMRHVPYRGSVPAMQDVMSGHIPTMVMDLQPAVAQIESGTVRALCTTTKTRVTATPLIPTSSEVGLDGFEIVAWQGVVAPAAVEQVVIDRIAGQIAVLAASPDFQSKLRALALEPLPPLSPSQFAGFVRDEIAHWTPIVAASGALLD